MASIGIALVGGGIFMKEQHVPAVLASPLLSIKAIYSRSLKSAEETHGLIPGDASASVALYSADSGEGKAYSDLLQRADVAGVIIALPIANQPEYIEAALAAGKHVLAEKPVAPDVATAQRLLASYRAAASSGATWAVAEQFRFLPDFAAGAREARKLGSVTGFAVRVFSTMRPDNKYYGTAWRREPTHPHGFLLDGGVHFVAATRLLLGPEAAPATVAGFAAQKLDHLPPADTVHGVVRTRSGAVGSFAYSCGTAMEANEYTVACERGFVRVDGGKVTVVRKGPDGERAEVVLELEAGGGGVAAEVQAWAEALVAGTPNPLQSPEEGLADLEFLEKLMKSGAEGGAPQELLFQ